MKDSFDSTAGVKDAEHYTKAAGAIPAFALLGTFCGSATFKDPQPENNMNNDLAM